MPPGTKNTIEVELRGKIEHLEGRLKTAETALESMDDGSSLWREISRSDN